MSDNTELHLNLVKYNIFKFDVSRISIEELEKFLFNNDPTPIHDGKYFTRKEMVKL